jgi:hypothetical protein
VRKNKKENVDFKGIPEEFWREAVGGEDHVNMFYLIPPECLAAH